MSNPISPKVTAGGGAGALALIIVWVAGQFGLEVPAEVAVAFTTLITLVASWVVPDSMRDELLAIEEARDVHSLEASTDG